MSRLGRLRARLHRRKRNRDRKRRLHQGRRALREARAVQKLRALIDRVHRSPRVLFDDTSVELIPSYAKAVAGYVNGSYTTWPAILKRFPKARRVSIAVTSDANADFLDVEPGDATNADAARWFRRKSTNRGFYTSASNTGALIAALASAGIRRHEYRLWSAHYSGTRHICAPKSCGYPAADATQWTDHSHGRSLDESALSPAFFD